MAWAIQTDGSNDQMSFTSVFIPTNENFTIRIVASLDDLINRSFAGQSGAFNNVIRTASASQWKFRANAVESNLDFIEPLVDFAVFDVEIKRTGGATGTIDIVDTATQSSLLVATVNNPNELALNGLFRYGNSSFRFLGEFQLLEITSTTVNNKWDATASDHSNTGAQPVLVDTVGGNDATGSGFPTDGSAWVDLGGGGGVILDIDSGSFALSGSDVLLRASRTEQVLTGGYNLSGSDIALSVGYAITLDSGMYSLSGSATGLVLNANTVIESGEYSLTGTQVNLDLARKSIIESGSYNLTGSDVTLIYTPSGGGEVLSIDSGTFRLSGSDIELKAARLISLNAGNYNLTGQSVALTYNAKTIIDGGSYALTGSNINLFANRVIIASSGSYTLSGTSVILKYSGDTYKTIGTVTAGFAQDRYSVEYKLNTITVNFKD